MLGSWLGGEGFLIPIICKKVSFKPYRVNCYMTTMEDLYVKLDHECVIIKA